jgi:uncharacterized protein (TIGR02001 family)
LIRIAPGAACAVALLLADPARAQTTPDLAIAYNAGVQSDYVFRGLDQTAGRGSAFAGVDAAYKGEFYAGAWTSNVDLSKLAGDRSTDEEVDLYGGWRPTAVGFNFDLGVQYFAYVDQPHGARADYAEVYAKASRGFGPVTLAAAIYASGEYRYHAGGGDYAELNASYAITPKWTVSGALGAAHFERTTVSQSYDAWNLGAAYAITPAVAVDLRYFDTDDHRFYGEAGRARLVAALKAAF